MSKLGNIHILLFFFLYASCFSQTDSSNKIDSKGKKTGYWKIYLNEKATITDSANAFFFGFEFYDGGKKTAELFKNSQNSDSYRVVYQGVLPIKGKPVAIDGTFKTFFLHKEKEELISEETFKHGFPVVFKEYMFDKLWTITDFTKKYNNTEGTFYFTDFRTYMVTTETRFKTTCYWYRKKNNRWKTVQTLCD